MDGIPRGVGSVTSLQLGAKSLPVLDAVLGYDFHASRDVALEELGGFSVVLRLDLHEARGSGAAELAHAELGDDKAVLVDSVNDLSSVHVDVGLNQGEGAFFICGEVSSREHISVVNELELSGKDGYDASDEELVHAHVSARHPLQEHLPSLQVKHLNRLILRVESKEVLADEAGLFIVPLSLKHESLFS